MKEKQVGETKRGTAGDTGARQATVTPEEALEHTRQLLHEKEERARKGPSWPHATRPGEGVAEQPQEAQRSGGISPEALHGEGAVKSGRQDQVKGGKRPD